MALIRLAFLALVFGFAASLVLYRVTGQAVWRQRAMGLLKWGVIGGLLFFGFIILRRAAVFI